MCARLQHFLMHALLTQLESSELGNVRRNSEAAELGVSREVTCSVGKTACRSLKVSFLPVSTPTLRTHTLASQAR